MDIYFLSFAYKSSPSGLFGVWLVGRVGSWLSVISRNFQRWGGLVGGWVGVFLVSFKYDSLYCLRSSLWFSALYDFPKSGESFCGKDLLKNVANRTECTTPNPLLPPPSHIEGRTKRKLALFNIQVYCPNKMTYFAKELCNIFDNIFFFVKVLLLKFFLSKPQLFLNIPWGCPYNLKSQWKKSGFILKRWKASVEYTKLWNI